MIYCKTTLFTLCFTLLVNLLIVPLYAQTQLGVDILGDADFDRFGSAIAFSADGNRVAIGGRSNDGFEPNAGQAKIYDWNGSTWTQLGEDIFGSGEDDEFGYAISLSAIGDIVAIGTYRGNFQSGYTRIYQWDGNNWTQLGDDISGLESLDRFGASLALSADGDKVIIGAPGDGVAGSGSVRVYEWDGNNWNQFGQDLTGEINNRYGNSVAISADGNRIACSAPVILPALGYVEVFEFNGQTLSQMGTTIVSDSLFNSFGYDISFSADGNRIVIGAEGSNEGGRNAGFAKIYEWNGIDWTQLGGTIIGEEGDLLGRAVSFSADGNRLAISATCVISNLPNTVTGFGVVYEWNGVDWVQLGEKIIGGAICQIVISGIGDRVAISSEFANQGYVGIYDLNSLTNINDPIKSNIKIYPNPTSNFLNIEGDTYSSLEIIDSQGRIVLKKTNQSRLIDISNLPSGMYNIQLYLKDKIITTKVFKSK